MTRRAIRFSLSVSLTATEAAALLVTVGALQMLLNRDPGAFLLLILVLGAGFAVWWRHRRRSRLRVVDTHPVTYDAWLDVQRTRLLESYGSDPERLEIASEDPEAQRTFDRLRLTPSEVSMVLALAAISDSTGRELAAKAVAADSPSRIELDGNDFTATTGLARVIVAMAGDPLFRDLPIAEILAGGRQWMLREASANDGPTAE